MATFHYTARATLILLDGTVLRRTITDYVICDPAADLEHAVFNQLLASSEADEVPVQHVTLQGLTFTHRSG